MKVDIKQKCAKEALKLIPKSGVIGLGGGRTISYLIDEIKENKFITKEILKQFHDEIFENYTILLKEDKNAMYRMKELWGYMSHIFTNNKKYYKKIKKAQKAIDYKVAVNSLFAEQEIIKGAGLFSNEE